MAVTKLIPGPKNNCLYGCLICGRSYGKREKMMYHVESAHCRLSLPCQEGGGGHGGGCGRTFPTREARRRHRGKCVLFQ